MFVSRSTRGRTQCDRTLSHVLQDKCEKKFGADSGIVPKAYRPITKKAAQVLAYKTTPGGQTKLGLVLSCFTGSVITKKKDKTPPKAKMAKLQQKCAAAKKAERESTAAKKKHDDDTKKKPTRRQQVARPFPGPLTAELCAKVHVAVLHSSGTHTFTTTCFSTVDNLDPHETVTL